jgi:hypothetical protein
MNKKLPDLPPSDDEYWEGAEKQKHPAVRLPICETHTKDNWTTHQGYIDNRDGTFSCRFCGWGGRLPGYLRIWEGKIVDLRSVEG